MGVQQGLPGDLQGGKGMADTEMQESLETARAGDSAEDAGVPPVCFWLGQLGEGDDI